MNTKTRKTGIKLGALLLCLCLLVGLLPVTASASSSSPVIYAYVETSGNSGSIRSISTEDQSQYTEITAYDKDECYSGLEMIDGTIYSVYQYVWNPVSRLAILNPDFTYQKTIGTGWYTIDAYIIDTTVQNGTLWGTYIESPPAGVSERCNSCLVPFDLEAGTPDLDQKHIVTGLPEDEFIRAIACNEKGEMYAITVVGAADVVNVGAATLYKIDMETFSAVKVGDTGVDAYDFSCCAFAPDGTLYWAENNESKLYTVDTSTGKATVVPGESFAQTEERTLIYAMLILDSTTDIDLPVRVLEGDDVDYTPAPELSAAFTPDTAVTVGEFNEFQGLAIDYYYPMIDAELSEGYDIQAGYTVSIPLTGYAGETLSGTLTIPLPQGYDGATARIKGGASASSYTATTVTFPLTLDVSGGTAEAFELLIEYKEAQEPVQPPVIIAGANGSWQKSGTDGLSFTSNAAFADFIKVQVDGKDLDASNYTVKEGSTIVTLNAAYLNTLSVGKHTLSIVSANGTATTEFTITAAQTGGDTTPQEPDKNGGDTTNPQTGDNSNVLLWIAILFVSGSGLFGATIYRRKRKIK